MNNFVQIILECKRKLCYLKIGFYEALKLLGSVSC